MISTTESIVRHQSRILTNSAYTQKQWESKFNLAQEKLLNDLSSRFNKTIAASDIINIQTLTIASDYLTLALTYTEMSSNGLNEV